MLTNSTIKSYDPRVMGEMLRKARVQAKVRQDEAAHSIGVARTTICGIEAGSRRVRVEELVSLCHRYGVEMQALLDACEEGAQAQAIQGQFTPSEVRVLTRLLSIAPTRRLDCTLQLFGVEQQDIEEITAALLHLLLERGRQARND